MFSPENKRRLLTLSAFVLPIVLVKVAGSMFDTPGPRAATAEVTPVIRAEPAPARAERTREPEPNVIAAIERIRELQTQPFGETPLHYLPRTISSSPPVEENSEPAFDPQLSSIMGSPRGHFAVIDNLTRRTGDVIDDWIITNIDPDEGIVRFRHSATGEEITRSLR